MTRHQNLTVEDFYVFNFINMWHFFRGEHAAFWCLCGYIFVEYFRPQAIYPAIDFLPWAKLFLGGALIFSFTDKKSVFKFSALHILVTLFAISIYLSFLVAYDIAWSKRYHIVFFQWILIFFLITSIATTRERAYVLLMIFILGSIKIAIGTAKIFAFRGFSFTKWGLMGPPGFFANSGELAIQMLITFVVGLAFYYCFGFNKKKKFQTLLIGLCIACSVLTIIGSSSRGAQLSLFAILLLTYWRKLFNPKGLIAIAGLAGMLYLFLPDEQKQRFQNMGDDRTSVQRKLYWTGGVEIIKSNPILGVGYYNFIPYFSNHFPHYVLFRNQKGERVAELPHNIFIQVGTDAGLLGLTWFGLILLNSLTSVRPSIQKITSQKNDYIFERSIVWAMAMGVLAFLLAGQFVTVAYYPFLWVNIAFLQVYRSLINNRKDTNTEPNKEKITDE